MGQVEGGRWWAWYFVVYYAFCTTLMANILTGLIIDAFDIAKVRSCGRDRHTHSVNVTAMRCMGLVRCSVQRVAEPDRT